MLQQGYRRTCKTVCYTCITTTQNVTKALDDFIRQCAIVGLRYSKCNHNTRRTRKICAHRTTQNVTARLDDLAKILCYFRTTQHVTKTLDDFVSQGVILRLGLLKMLQKH